MALTATTLSSAVAVYDRTIVVAAASGFAAGATVKVDQEIMRVDKSYTSGTTIPVLRGRDGTPQQTHVASAPVQVSVTGTDFSSTPAGSLGVPYVGPLVLDVRSYTAASALDLPVGPCIAVRIINGTSNPAMTLAAPPADLDGCIMIVATSGKCTATLTVNGSTVGIGNGGGNYDVLTAQNGAQIAVTFVAVNGFWVLAGGILTGTATALTWGVA